MGSASIDATNVQSARARELAAIQAAQQAAREAAEKAVAKAAAKAAAARQDAIAARKQATESRANARNAQAAADKADATQKDKELAIQLTEQAEKDEAKALEKEAAAEVADKDLALKKSKQADLQAGIRKPSANTLKAQAEYNAAVKYDDNLKAGAGGKKVGGPTSESQPPQQPQQDGAGGTDTAADPTTIDGLQKQFPSLAGRNSEDMQKLADNVRKLRDGSFSEKVQALAELGEGLTRPELEKLAAGLNLKDNPVYKLVTDGESLAALGKLADPKASVSDKAGAALTLLKSLGELVPGKAGEALRPYLEKLPGGNAIIDAYNTFSDPNASTSDRIVAGLELAGSLGKLAPKQVQEALSPVLSAVPGGKALVQAIAKWVDPKASKLDKFKATLELAQAVRDSAGDAFPSIAHNLRSLDSSLRSINAGLTLLDPNATAEDKALAALTLYADVPQLAGDLSALKRFLVSNGVADGEQIVQQIDRMPPVQRLPEAVRKNLNPDTASHLTAAQADQIAKGYAESAEEMRRQALEQVDDPTDANKLAAATDDARKSADEFGASISKTLNQIKDKDALSAFAKSLSSGTDHAARKALVDTLGELKPGVADKLLVETIDGKPGADVLMSVLAKLKDNPDALKKFTDIIADGDHKTVKLALQIGESVEGKGLTDALGLIGDSKLAGKAFRLLATVLDKAGVKITSEIAQRILRGVAKIVPFVGAIPAMQDAGRMADIAADKSLPPDIRFAAAQAAKLNAADAALSVVEPFVAEFEVPVALDVSMGVGELGLDIIVSDQKAKFEANPAGYRAPDWLKAINVGLAVAQGPTGVAEAVLYYGPNGTVDLAGAVARVAGKAAFNAAVLQQQLTAQGIGKGLHYTAEGLHRLADIVRNPKKYGAAADEAAVKTLSDLARGGGEVGKLANKELDHLVGDLEHLGVDGAKALGWIASHPSESATKAINALSDLANRGLKLGSAADREVARAALTALGDAKDALGKGGHEAAAIYHAAERAVTHTVDSAIARGEQGIKTLGWIAKNPGTAAHIAQQALVDTAAKAGHLSKEAYDQLVGLGKSGEQLLEDVAGKLKDAGDAGVEMLKYVVSHPGQAADTVRKAALSSLKWMAEGASHAATAAVHAILGFVDNGIQEAKDTATELLESGGTAVKKIAAVWGKNLSEGGKEVIGGLQDLGGAGLNALSDLSKAGVGFAHHMLGKAGGLAKRALGWAF